jgi:PAS domain S-box-containing protein
MLRKATAASLLPYGIAVAAIGVTLLARWLLQPALQNHIPYLMFVLPVSLSAWYGGLCPGLFATFISGFVAELLLVRSHPLAKLDAGVGAIQFILFLFVGLLISWLSEKRLVEARAAKKSSELLDETGQHLEAMVQASPLAIMVVNQRGEVQLWNPAAERIFGWRAAEVIGRQIPIVPEERLASFHGSLRKTPAPGAVGDLRGTEVLCVRKSSGSLAFELWEAPLRDASGAFGLTLYMLADISTRKEAERERADLLNRAQVARLEAERTSRLKDEFLATLSHELRTPLNAILGWARLLHGGQLDSTTKLRAIESVERNARVQTKLVEDLLDVSRIITGKWRLETRPVDLCTSVEAAIETIRATLETKGIALEKELDLSIGLIMGDPNRVQQILWNLLSNAVKFTPNGGHIQVRVTREGGNAAISVKDSGKGINEEFLPYVFERFRQADGSLTRKYGGLGLGLAIARHLTELHGGSIEAESAGDDQGSVFTVKFPLLSEWGSQRLASDVVHLPSAVVPPTPPELSIALKGLRVLVVDDEPGARELLLTILTHSGAEVATGSSASEALAELARFKPDVLISDIEMPAQDGYSLIRQLRLLEDDLGQRIRAVALTAHARTEDRLQAFAAGFDTHVSKPVEPAELVTVVASLARRRTKAQRTGVGFDK